MIIKDVKFSYVDRKYKLGPYIDFISELEVPSTEYYEIVKTIQKQHPDYEQVKVMSFTKK
jgi:hypothetical protein